MTSIMSSFVITSIVEHSKTNYELPRNHTHAMLWMSIEFQGYFLCKLSMDSSLWDTINSNVMNQHVRKRMSRMKAPIFMLHHVLTFSSTQQESGKWMWNSQLRCKIVLDWSKVSSTILMWIFTKAIVKYHLSFIWSDVFWTPSSIIAFQQALASFLWLHLWLVFHSFTSIHY